MKISNVFESKSGFKVLQTAGCSQTAVMALASGESSSEQPNTHANSDQVLIVLEGEVEAEIGSETATLRRGDSVIVPAGTPHRFSNRSSSEVVTFSVYAPPEY